MPSNAVLTLLYRQFICLKVNTSETVPGSLSDNWSPTRSKVLHDWIFLPKSTKPPTSLIFILLTTQRLSQYPEGSFSLSCTIIILTPTVSDTEYSRNIYCFLSYSINE